MHRSDILPFLVSLGITGLLIWGLVYFVNEWWGRLPTVVALILFMFSSESEQLRWIGSLPGGGPPATTWAR